MPEFTDAQLVVILQKASRRINRKLCLTGTPSETSIDTTTGEILPDDGDLQDLVLLQAECLISQRYFTDFLSPDSAAAGALVKDGEQTIDTRAAGSARGTAFDSSISPCAELESQLAQEKMNRQGGPDGAGKLIW